MMILDQFIPSHSDKDADRMAKFINVLGITGIGTGWTMMATAKDSVSVTVETVFGLGLTAPELGLLAQLFTIVSTAVFIIKNLISIKLDRERLKRRQNDESDQ